MATMRRSLWNVPLAPLPASHDGFHQSATRGLPTAVDDRGGVVYGAQDIYNRAINVSSPRFDGDAQDPESTTFRKKVVRRVEVPYTREVKVPASSTQLVDAMVQQPVTVRRHIAVPSTKLVEEPYTSYEEKDAVRDREVWVRQIVPERYKVRVPVQRTRVVEMPTTVIREVDQVVTVAVPTTRSVQVDGFRVDQVQDSKVMEVEEFQQYRMRPEPVGPPQPHTARELGRVPGARHLTRTPGPAVFHPEHPAVTGVQHDSPSASPLPYGSSTSRARGLTAPLSRVGTASMSRSLPYAAPAATRALPMASSSYYPSRPVLDARAAPTATYSRADPALNNNFTYGARALTGSARDSPSLYATQSVRAAGGFKKEASLTKTVTGADREGDTGQYMSPPLGITVRGTHTRHTDGTGVLVSRVERASLAARAGLIDNDIITAVGGRPITTVDEFRSMLTRPDGAAVPVEFNRDGRKGVLVFVPRPGGAPQ